MGARILNYVLLFAAGIVLGALGSVAQQSVTTIGSAQLPTGLIVALLAVACLLVGLRLLNETRWAAFVAALGVVIPAVVFAAPSAGGSVLIPANGPGYAWIFSPVVIAIIAVGWPSFGARASRAGTSHGDAGENGAGQTF